MIKRSVARYSTPICRVVLSKCVYIYVHLFVSRRRFVGSSDLCDVTYKYHRKGVTYDYGFFFFFSVRTSTVSNARGALFSNLQHADLSRPVNRLYPDRRNICMMSRLKLRITRTPSIDHRYRILYYLSSLIYYFVEIKYNFVGYKKKERNRRN